MPRLGGLLQEPHTSACQVTRSIAACRKRSWSSGLPRNSGAPPAQAEAAVAAILTTIKEALQHGEPVHPAALWHVAGAGQAGAPGSEPEDGGRGRHSGPAGRPVQGRETLEAGRCGDHALH